MPFHYSLDLCLTEQAQGLYTTIADRDNGNAGFDLKAAEDFMVSSQSTSLLPLGCSARLLRIDDVTGDYEPSHFWLLPRSSIFKAGIRMSNSVGVIDSTYRGELKAPVIAEAGSQGAVMTRIEKGTRLFQIVAPDMGWIREVHIVSSLPETSRGAGGFGSTGSK